MILSVVPRIPHDRQAGLRRAREALAEGIAERQALSDVARRAGLSPFHFQRLFSRSFGESPHEFLSRRRIEEARRLLAQTDLPVTEVCFAVGYESLGSFSHRFRERVGYSPSAYRRRLRRSFPVPQVAPYSFIPTCFLRHYGQPALPE